MPRGHDRQGRPDVAASFGPHHRAWPAHSSPSRGSRAAGRPGTRVAAVSRHRATGRAAVRPATSTCLPGGTAAVPPGAASVPEEALRAGMRVADACVTCPRARERDRFAELGAHIAA
ncbi:hypothetical protein [Streptomyces cellostaticus]|uniref:hypothetical protein n=1 Tax=Streptomyces cellostaticus TaxID=67285 RepID=UPI002026C99D|nr:hypothetical protein [Streptomyces cellostaticus]